MYQLPYYYNHNLPSFYHHQYNYLWVYEIERLIKVPHVVGLIFSKSGYPKFMQPTQSVTFRSKLIVPDFMYLVWNLDKIYISLLWQTFVYIFETKGIMYCDNAYIFDKFHISSSVFWVKKICIICELIYLNSTITDAPIAQSMIFQLHYDYWLLKKSKYDLNYYFYWKELMEWIEGQDTM
jgi:hypothetical protein